MRIKTERLMLESISLYYLKSLHAYSSDLENTHYMCYLPHDSIEESRAFIMRSMEEWA